MGRRFRERSVIANTNPNEGKIFQKKKHSCKQVNIVSWVLLSVILIVCVPFHEFMRENHGTVKLVYNELHGTTNFCYNNRLIYVVKIHLGPKIQKKIFVINVNSLQLWSLHPSLIVYGERDEQSNYQIYLIGDAKSRNRRNVSKSSRKLEFIVLSLSFFSQRKLFIHFECLLPKKTTEKALFLRRKMFDKIDFWIIDWHLCWIQVTS